MPLTHFNIHKGYAVFAGEGIETIRHAHHAYELVINEYYPFDLITEEQRLNHIYSALIRPDIAHEFAGEQGSYYVILIDPELVNTHKYFDNLLKTTQYAVSLDRYFQTNSILPKTYTNTLLKNLENSKRKTDNLDSRIQCCLDLIDLRLINGSITLESLANAVHLSPSRLYHLFKSEIGISIRQYILWNRIKYATEAILSGKNLKNAAYIGGFSDPSHFSKTFKTMFGVAPSSIFKE